MPLVSGLKGFAWRCRAHGVRLVRDSLASASRVRLTPARRRRLSHALEKADTGKRVTLFLAPDAGIAPFYASHAILARTLSDAGHAVLLLSCDGVQPICSVKFATQIGPTRPGDTRNQACSRCRVNALRTGQDYNIPDIAIEALLDARRRTEIGRIVSENAEAPWNVVYDDIAIGAACLGEALRAQRKTSIEELDAEDRALLAALLYSSLAIYFAVKDLAARFKIERIVYFGDYAYFLPPQVFAHRNGIALTHVSHAYNRDIDRRHIVLWPGHGVTHMLSQVERWAGNRALPITPSLVDEIANGALFRLRGHGGASTYSPNWKEDPGDLRRTLGLPEAGKLLVAYSNSTDELVCNREFMRVLGGSPYESATNPFPSQIEWLRSLVDWTVRRGGLNLIIRLHPRMAVSHRHATVASEYAQIMAALGNLPRNVAVVPPESDLSSYNLAELADVALTAWSSIGLELARFGVPVVAAFQKIGPFPTGGFVGFAETPEGYFSAVESALRQPASIEAITEAFRWTHFLHWSSLIDVSDLVPTPDYEEIPPYHPARNRDAILKVMTEGADLVALNMERLPRGAAAIAAEKTAIEAALNRFIYYLITGKTEPIPRLAIRIGDATSRATRTTADGAPLLIVGHDNDVSLGLHEREIERRSALVARLARAVASVHATA